MTKIRITIDGTGLVEVRNLPPDEAVIALTTIISREARIRARLPSHQSEAFEEKLAEARQLSTDIEAAAALQPDEAPVSPPAPDPELLTLAPQEVLTEPRSLNHLIDKHVKNVERIVLGNAEGPAADEETRAGQVLRQRIFPDGRTFLTYAHKRQWFAVRKRFTQFEPEERDAITLLNLERAINRVVALNDYFGALLGITLDADAHLDDLDPATEEVTLDQLMEQFTTFITSWLGFANHLAPSATEAEDEALRLDMLSPYLEPILKRVSSRSNAAKARADAPGQANEDDPEET